MFGFSRTSSARGTVEIMTYLLVKRTHSNPTRDKERSIVHCAHLSRRPPSRVRACALPLCVSGLLR